MGGRGKLTAASRVWQGMHDMDKLARTTRAKNSRRSSLRIGIASKPIGGAMLLNGARLRLPGRGRSAVSASFRQHHRHVVKPIAPRRTFRTAAVDDADSGMYVVFEASACC
jgi:hypothetical protein